MYTPIQYNATTINHIANSPKILFVDTISITGDEIETMQDHTYTFHSFDCLFSPIPLLQNIAYSERSNLYFF